MAQFKVKKLDRNHKRTIGQCFVRADSLQHAERIGRAVLGRGVIVACEYRPECDPAFRGFIGRVVTKQEQEAAQ